MAILEKIKELIKPLLKEEGIELIDATYRRENGRMVLRLLVDRAGGIKMGECAVVNTQIGELLEKENTIEDRYTIEVDSPGLDRRFTGKPDFERTLGELIRIVDKKGKNYIGKVIGLNTDEVVLEERDGESAILLYSDIAVARIEVEF
ncbi:MAG: ribosome maturation factor RimP [Candidatus Omnitrophica bacterium]|nr:ribosome maturation factor RimP [Candidatus Omnitrophota bacterium]